MITRFEELANEVLLDIFDYIESRNLFRNFWNLNFRLNKLLGSLNNLPLLIEENEEEFVDLFAHHIGRLRVKSWDDINLSRFCNLISLTLSRAAPSQLKQIRADTMPKLVYLSPSSSGYYFSPNQLVEDVFTNKFFQLRWARLGHLGKCDPLLWFQASSLRSLRIIWYNASIIPFILASCPFLAHLHVYFLDDGDKITVPLPVITNHPLRHLVLRDFCHLLSYNDIDVLLNYIPNVEVIELKFDCQVPFIRLATNLAERLSHLRRFDCHIVEQPLDITTSLKKIHDIHACFLPIQCRTLRANFRIFITE